MGSLGRLMDWTMKDSMVNVLFFCATLTSHSRGHTLFMYTGAETSDISAEAVKLHPCCVMTKRHNTYHVLLKFD